MKCLEENLEDDEMIMVVRISGSRYARIEHPMMIFKNMSSNYPILGLSEDIPGVCHCTGLNGRVLQNKTARWVTAQRSLTWLPNDRRPVLFMDNCSSLGFTEKLNIALQLMTTELCFSPANFTDLLQHADSFVIQKINEASTACWEKHKISAMSEAL